VQETGSPPPDERAFVDDDGTHFVWDVQLRKFVPSELQAADTSAPAAAAIMGNTAAVAATAAAPQPEYTAEIMRFQGTDENIVSIEEARAEEAASEALAEQLLEARAQGTKVRPPSVPHLPWTCHQIFIIAAGENKHILFLIATHATSGRAEACTRARIECTGKAAGRCQR
jgi:hypothetical protein